MSYVEMVATGTWPTVPQIVAPLGLLVLFALVGYALTRQILSVFED